MISAPLVNSEAPVAVIGGGIMGRGIAASLALAGHAVTIAETDPTTAAGLAERVAGALRADEGLDPEDVDAALSRISVVSMLEDAVACAALCIEAAPEQLSIKSDIWSRMGASAPQDSILATNTSALDVDALAALVPSPDRVLGTHWFNPAHVIPCVELVRGEHTSQDVIDETTRILVRAGKQPVVVRNSPGFVANRIQFALVREALLCLEEGLASAEDIDRIVSSSFGVRLAVLGPLANADLGGLDTYRWILEFLTSTLGDRFAVPGLLAERVDAGQLGTKSGVGISSYPDDAADRLARYRDETLRRVIAAVKERSSRG
ncbi:MAG: 3-hydroxyacyl-CoA dehydrogenase family protein [Rhodoglobus sp.]|nr:3-hydroxyacyl-CoA dehydrogenase family protein [Rhodoglobus sp.]